jgi:Glycosyltransferase family 17
MRFLKPGIVFSGLFVAFIINLNFIGGDLKSFIPKQTCIDSLRDKSGSIADAFQNIPHYEVDELYKNAQKKIDDENGNKRCARFGLKISNNTKPRRIFFGATVADDNWDVFLIHSVEAYDVYHVAVFVESNTTFTATPRTLRFHNSEESNLILSSKIFGPKTQAFIDPWLVDWPDLVGMNREAEQRNAILKRWQKEGMRPEDVGIMSDIDEVISRDFLRAIQICDFPELRPDQDCHRPKIVPSCIAYEATPYCIKRAKWFHPDVISGQCIDGIGDPTERVVPLRKHRRRYGERDPLYGKRSLHAYPDAVRSLGRYPLFNGPDIRTVVGNRNLLYNVINASVNDTHAVTGVAYHLHNWFSDFKILRQKYMTYGHANKRVMNQTLAQIGVALAMLVRCVKQLGNQANRIDWERDYIEEGWNMTTTLPIYFLNNTYVSMRHDLVKKIIRRDEAEFGANDKDMASLWTMRRFKVT